MGLPGRAYRDRVALVAALLGPPAVCAVLALARGRFANTHAALLLVLVVVAIAANGHRLAGLLAAVSAAVWFDVLLTPPYGQLAIARRVDVETTVLLLFVGIGVTELAVWGRRQHGLASRDAGYLAGVYAAAEAGVSGRSPNALIGEVSEQLVRTLGLTRCHFDYRTGLDQTRLRHDGQVVSGGTVVDVESQGLPGPGEIELLVEGGGRFWGRFLLSAAPDSRPVLAQRLVAVALADQVGAALSGYTLRESS
jgi:hypothetical protein